MRHSNPRLTFQIAATILLCAFALVWYCLDEPRQPKYQGVKLSRWLDQFLLDQNQEARPDAAEAIQRIGTNAIPILLKRIAYKDSFWRRIVGPRFGRRDVPHQAQMRATAVRGFEHLGSNAVSAIPDLVRLLGAAPECALAMGGIGPAALPQLSSALTNANPEVRANAIAALRNLGDAASVALLTVATMAADPDYRVRLSAVLMLGDARPSARNKDALAGCLRDPEAVIRARSAEALGKYGADAISQTSDLAEPTNDPSKYVSAQARAALQKIQSAENSRFAPGGDTGNVNAPQVNE